MAASPLGLVPGVNPQDLYRGDGRCADAAANALHQTLVASPFRFAELPLRGPVMFKGAERCLGCGGLGLEGRQGSVKVRVTARINGA